MNIYKENKMMMEVPESLTLVKSRTQVKQTFDEELFENVVNGGQVLRCTWNTGEFMVDPSQSALTFTISVKDTVPLETFSFGSLGAIQLFRQIVIRSASGVELCRLDEPAIWQKIKFQADTSLTKQNTIAEPMGLRTNDTVYSWFVYNVDTPSKFQKHKFMIPLDFLAPLFCPISSDTKYMPSQLCEGLTFEFYLNSLAKTFTAPATTQFYNIHNISFILDTVILNDRSLKELQNKCHKKGLEWVCKDVHKQDITGVVGGEDVSNQINFSVSQALRTVTVYRRSDDVSIVSNKGYFVAVAPSFIARSGADYYPRQRVDDTGNNEPVELFQQTKYTFPHMSFPLQKWKTDSAFYAVNLNMSDFLDLSGVIVNNSKTLEYLGSGSTEEETKTLVFNVSTLMDYVKVVKIVGRNIAVAI